MRSLYIEAAAAGISDEEFNKLTLTKLLARIEGAQLSRYWFARPVLTAMMPHLSEDGVKDIVLSDSRVGPSKPSMSGRALEILLRDYLPPYIRNRRQATKGARANKGIPGLPVEAARGMMESYNRGDFNDNVVWVSINPYFAEVSFTAKRGGE